MSSQCKLNRWYICCKTKKKLIREKAHILLNPSLEYGPLMSQSWAIFSIWWQMYSFWGLFTIYSLACLFVSSPLSFRACLVRLLPGFLSAYPIYFHYLLYIFSSGTCLEFFQQVMNVDLVWPVNLQDFLGKLLMKVCVLLIVTFVILQDSELGLFPKYSWVPDVLKP